MLYYERLRDRQGDRILLWIATTKLKQWKNWYFFLIKNNLRG